MKVTLLTDIQPVEFQTHDSIVKASFALTIHSYAKTTGKKIHKRIQNL